MAELIAVSEELRIATEHQQEYIKGLEEMIEMTSHQVRQPISQILGISALLDQYISSPFKLLKSIGYIKESALSLESYTTELTLFIQNLKKRHLPKTKK